MQERDGFVATTIVHDPVAKEGQTDRIEVRLCIR